MSVGGPLGSFHSPKKEESLFALHFLGTSRVPLSDPMQIHVCKSVIYSGIRAVLALYPDLDALAHSGS